MGSSSTAAGRALPALGAALLSACASAPQSADSPFLHVTPTRVERSVDPQGPLVVAVATRDPAALARALAPVAILERSEAELVVRLVPYPVRPAPQTALHRASTFLVDFESKPVRALVAERAGGTRPTLPELIDWTREVIEPSYDRGFDAASVIARNRRGDCTEHAVLLAALARSFGYPARIAVGQVIAEFEGRIQAFGHAWTEVHSDGGWQLFDATPVEGVRAIGYLPEGHLRDESAGFALELLRVLQTQVTGIRVRADPGPR